MLSVNEKDRMYPKKRIQYSCQESNISGNLLLFTLTNPIKNTVFLNLLPSRWVQIPVCDLKLGINKTEQVIGNISVIRNSWLDGLPQLAYF